MKEASRYFVFVYPALGEVRDYLNLAVFALSPREKWPAHITVAGPFSKRPSSRAKPKFNSTVFSLGVWHFFNDGLNTVYLKVGMPALKRYWLKPGFATNAVPHLSLYNGIDAAFSREIFNKLQPLNLQFSFPVKSIEIVKSSAQRLTDLRQQINADCLKMTEGMQLDDIALLSNSERLEIAVQALKACQSPSNKISNMFLLS